MTQKLSHVHAWNQLSIFKPYFGSHLLVPVGQDANNAFFVIAYAVVNAEDKDN